MEDWLHVTRANTPLLLAFPHGGMVIPDDLADDFRSHWWAVRDTDWHIRDLYAGLAEATTVATDISRSVIDCNRDPSGASLYPGQATTELCPTTTFDGDPLYRDGVSPDVAARRAVYFDPYHATLAAEIARLRERHDRVVVFDCHSIRSRIPRLFKGELPELNVGTKNGATCSPELAEAVLAQCADRSHVLNGRFKGGWTTRHYGRPGDGVHAIQMEIAIRAYATDPPAIDEGNWPPAWDPAFAAPLRVQLSRILTAALDFAKGPA